MPRYECQSCHRTQRGTPRKTMTGRTVCPACADQLLGLATGLVASETVGGAISTAGWFARIRKARGRSS
jgi:hypothetical protein